MTNNNEFKAIVASRLAGMAIIIYVVIIFVVSLFADDSFRTTEAVFIFLSFVAFSIGLGILKQNYYAWFAGMVIASLLLFAHAYQIVITLSSGSNATIATKAILPLLIFASVYASKDICAKNRNSAKISEIFTQNFPSLIAAFISVVTVLALKITENTGMLVFGFPFIILEFGFIYVVGMSLQKRYLIKFSSGLGDT